MILHLGVLDIPYAQAPKRYRRRNKVAAGTQTTGDVATWLENRYGVMQAFANRYEDKIGQAVEQSVLGAVDSLLMGAPATLNAFGAATSQIEDDFKQFLSSKEVETIGIPGLPSEAALRGVNHRMKRPYVKRAPRPSLIDTGLYSASFKAWVD